MGEFKVEEWKDLRQVNWIKNVAYPTLGALEAFDKVSDMWMIIVYFFHF